MTVTNIATYALEAIRARFSVIPTNEKKEPTIKAWAQYQERIPTVQEVIVNFPNGCNIAVIGGSVSGNLGILDFDLKGEYFKPFMEIVNREKQNLCKSLVYEQSPSGGYHIFVRVDGDVGRNIKLAGKPFYFDKPGEYEICGKRYKTREVNGKHVALVNAIETRGNGGYCLTDPSKGYNFIKGSLLECPKITAEDWYYLLDTAKSFDSWLEPSKIHNQTSKPIKAGSVLPGDAYNEASNDVAVIALLESEGWVNVGKSGDNTRMRRPGKRQGCSGTVRSDGFFYCFTSNAPPFEPQEAYSPFAVNTILNHGGDYSAAAQQLFSDGYGDNPLFERKQKDKIKYEINQPITLQGYTAAELVNMEFPEPKWIILNILTEGVTVLCAKPKMGKSILSLNTGIAVALGGKALGKIDVEKGSVLYLALEDVPRRLKTRIQQMLTYGGRAPDKLYLFTNWPKMGAGGLSLLREEIQKHEDIRLVIIDTLKMFKPQEKSRNKAIYDVDYEPIAAIKEIADEFNIAILIVHHLRKSESEDIFDTVSGSLGLTAAADNILILARKTGNADAVLHINGRDVEPAEYALRFEPSILSWNLLGDAQEVKSTNERQLLYDTIKEYNHPISPKELSEISGLRHHYVKKTLPLLIRDGDIKKVGRGKYIYIGNHGNHGNHGNLSGLQLKEVQRFPSGTKGGNLLKDNNIKDLQGKVPIVPKVPIGVNGFPDEVII